MTTTEEKVTQHASGPWSFAYDSVYAAKVFDGEGRMIAKVLNGDTADADARLMAAAPTLLEVCRGVLDMLGGEAHCYKVGEMAKRAVALVEGSEARP